MCIKCVSSVLGYTYGVRKREKNWKNPSEQQTGRKNPLLEKYVAIYFFIWKLLRVMHGGDALSSRMNDC